MENIRIGLVGAGWMGKAHAISFNNAKLLSKEGISSPVFEIVADVIEDNVKTIYKDLNFNRWTTNWEEVVTDEKVDLVDIATPNAFHFEIAKMALENGKHVYCEKPLTLSYEESKILADLAKEKGVVNYVGYNNVLNPANNYVKELIEEGALGEITQFKGMYDQDGLLDPDSPITWRHINKFSGSGALGDLGSHLLSISQYLMGNIEKVNAISKTFITKRPKNVGSKEMAPVENEDVITMIAKYENNALGTISSSRIAAGRKNNLSYEIQGTKGTVYYSLEAMNEVHVYFTDDAIKDRGFRKVFLNTYHNGYSTFQPADGIAIGYNDIKILEAKKVLNAICNNESIITDFKFAEQMDATIKAILNSAKNLSWETV
ncbi:Gfo/Idh/MocA family protein [Staphylococcus kloosii]|uniref:Gfo/Idh/MocA family protein n=1 Tax=Staphylococcus kloosii TaxID=29384 RepID=UPI00189FC56B|nr:Gfo/Idh/MocA family oxidoreductase [Staphylococcus kloosii]MBF7025537.1 Gfo/Idh/MocA family oxidoreductase [Staphylococcus kloosii]